MKIKYLVWLRNIVLILLVGRLVYYLVQRFYYGFAVEFGSVGTTASIGALILLQYVIGKQTEKK